MAIAKKLRVLLIEASPDDARHTLAKLEQCGYAVEYQQMDNAHAMQAALSEGGWDAVLCSYDPPGFCGLDALRLMQAAGIDLPFLFLSHDQREETIIQAMQAGAGDYIFKDGLNRLVPAIVRSQREARIRREYLDAQYSLQEYQTRLHAFIANLPGMACQVLLKSQGGLFFPSVSEGGRSLLGLNPGDLEQNPELFLNMLYPNDRDSFHQTMHASADSLALWNWEGRVVMAQNGKIKWLNLRCTPCKLERRCAVGRHHDQHQPEQTGRDRASGVAGAIARTILAYSGCA